MFESSKSSKQEPVFHSLSDVRPNSSHGGERREFDGWDDESDPTLVPDLASSSSVPLEQLLSQLDLPRSERPRRDLRPDWLRELSDCIANLFEPLSHAGRVGFDSVPDQGRWVLSFYLGAAEHVGGALDGHVEPINFRFDVGALLKCFEKVERCNWSVFPSPESIGVDGVSREDIPRGLASIKIDGAVMTETGLAENVSVEIHSLPPAESRIGLKLYSDGGISPGE